MDNEIWKSKIDDKGNQLHYYKGIKIYEIPKNKYEVKKFIIQNYTEYFFQTKAEVKKFINFQVLNIKNFENIKIKLQKLTEENSKIYLLLYKLKNNKKLTKEQKKHLTYITEKKQYKIIKKLYNQKYGGDNDK